MESRIIHAFECGVSHQLHGLPCQDRAGGSVGAALSVAVLCDGAGSCAQSELAAQLLVQWLPEYLQTHFDPLYFRQEDAACLVRDGQAALSALGLPLSECYCTLLFFAQYADGRWLCGHIGDGYIFLQENGESRVLSHPENGAHSYETYFLSGTDASGHLRLQRGHADAPHTVLLTSDGGGESLFDRQTQTCAPAVDTLCRWAASPQHSDQAVTAALQKALHDQLAAHTDDDISVALLWLDAPAPGERSAGETVPHESDADPKAAPVESEAPEPDPPV